MGNLRIKEIFCSSHLFSVNFYENKVDNIAAKKKKKKFNYAKFPKENSFKHRNPFRVNLI